MREGINGEDSAAFKWSGVLESQQAIVDELTIIEATSSPVKVIIRTTKA